MLSLLFCFDIGVKEIDIAATLEHIRDQRPGMVRTKVMKNLSNTIEPHIRNESTIVFIKRPSISSLSYSLLLP